MSNQSFVQKPIRLVSVTQQGKYTIDPDGANFISQIQKPIGVVSVAGLYRTGKSYLLNRMLLNKSSGFGVGSTINACTKGLWCWGTPIKGTTPEGQKINVIIIDSEGIGALDQDQNHDTKIFTLAVLSASTFIYNSVGSIDQNALQNLSLVVNLSKNIQINAQSQEEDADPQQLAQYFPSFCWVVRDFSLQLINGNGDTITPNEYLQRALALQKGFSDDIEDKNRIRRLLTAFFKSRQCITLVRPLVNQTKLQQLQKLQLQELRPQFVEQVLQLRKKILQRLNPKKFKNQILDGKMYLNVLTSYVSAINQGAVPNMQNAWSYMCQQKCYHTFQECQSIMDRQIQQIEQSIPFENEKIAQLCDQVEQQVYKKYLQETKGMQKQRKQLFQQLKQKVKSIIKDIKRKNQKLSLNILKNHASKSFHPIQKKMAAGEYNKYQDFIKQLNGFYTSILETGPNLPNKQLVFTDFTKKAAIQGAQLLIKSFYKSFQNRKALWQQQKLHMQKKTQQLKSQLQRQIAMKKQQLLQLDEQNTDLLANLQVCKQQLENIKLKQIQQQQQFNHQLKQKRQQYERQAQQLLKQINDVKVLLNQLQKQKYELEKQLQKSNAIFELKQQQYVEQINEYKRKQTANMTEMLKFKGQTQQKYEKLLTQVEQKMNDYKRKYEIQTLKSQQMRQKIDQMQEQIQDLQKQNLNLTQSSQKQNSKLKQQFNIKTTKLEEQITQLQTQLQTERENHVSLKQKFITEQSESTKISSEIQQKYIQQSSEYKKQKAIFQQKITFLQMEIKELEQNHNANVQYYEGRISDMQKLNKQVTEKFNEQKVREIQRQIQSKFKIMQKNLQQEKYNMQTELQMMRKQKQNLSFDLQMQRKTKQTEVTKYKKVIEAIEQQLTTSKQSKTQVEGQLAIEHEQKVSALQYKIKELEMELENYKQEQQNYQMQRSNKSQEAVMQLKNYYELEKQRLEQKNLKQKQKYEKKIQQVIEEYEQKIKQETSNLQEEYQILKQEFGAYQVDAKQTISMLQHQLDLKEKAYNGLEVQYTEQKVCYQKKQIQLAQKNQFLSVSLNQERQAMQKRVDDVLREKSKLEKQAITLAHKNQQLINAAKSKQQKVSVFQKQINDLNKQLQMSKAETRAKQSSLQSQYMEKIINYEKKIALLKQQNQFFLKKHQQLEKNSEIKSKVYEDKIQSLKTQLQQGLKTNDQKKAKQLGQIEEKYQKLKKSSKQSQSSYIKRVSSLERQLAIEQEKCINLQTRVSQHKQTNVSLEEKLSLQIQILKSSLSDEKNQLLMKIQSLKQTIGQLQAEKQSMNSQYEKEVILKENKIKYLEESKQKNRKQMTEKIKRVQELLAKNQKERKQEKSSIQITVTDQIKKIEKKHQQEIKDLLANYQKRESQSQQRRKILEGQNRKLSQKVASSTQFNSQSYMLQQRKLNEAQQNQKRLLRELQVYKSSAKTYSNDTFMLYEKEKETLKSKLVEKQQKLRLAQKLKQQYFYELQKQKAKTNVQKESFIMKIEELKETISKNERDLQKYQRQNEKLKVQKRQSMGKVQLGRYSVNKSHYGANNMTERSGLQQSMSFLNVSVTSSIRDNRENRSFNKSGKQYLKGYQQKLQTRQNSERFSEKNSEVEKDKQNFRPILDEESFFCNQ